MHKNVMFSLEYKHKIESTINSNNIRSRNEPWPIEYTTNTSEAAATGTKNATKIYGQIPKVRKFPFPNHQIMKCKTTS